MERVVNCHAYGCHTSFKVMSLGDPTHFIDVPTERVNINCPQCGAQHALAWKRGAEFSVERTLGISLSLSRARRHTLAP
jgi:hypothetical protein